MGGRGAKSGLTAKYGIGGAGGSRVTGGSNGGTLTNGRTDDNTDRGTFVGGAVRGAGVGGGAGAGGAGPADSGTIRERQTVSGVDVIHYREVHEFGDGTAQGVYKTAEADVYETTDGVKFIFPRNYDRAVQFLTPSLMLKAWDQLPDIMKALAARTIEILDYYNPQDDYWRRTYENFTHSFATGGIQKISFYRCSVQMQTSRIVETLCHETGHTIDRRLNNYSDRAIWRDAMKADERVSHRKSPTSYGENANAEDFAESMKMYITKPDWFAREFPNRKRLIDSILGSF